MNIMRMSPRSSWRKAFATSLGAEGPLVYYTDPDCTGRRVLDTFAVVGEQGSVAAGFRDRYGDCVDRLSFYTQGGEGGAAFWEPIIADLSTT